MRKFILFICFVVLSFSSSAQLYMGTKGLATIPSADMAEDGHFVVGVNYLPTVMTPDEWDYPTHNYFLNITFLPFLEVAYRCTIFLFEDYANQDRSIALRLRLLKEGKYHPSIVIGSHDLLTNSQLDPTKKSHGNRFYSGLYGVTTKNFNIKGSTIGLTLGASISSFDSFDPSVFAGVNYNPRQASWLTVMGEYKEESFSFGASALLWRHFGLHVIYYDFKHLSAGIRYEITLY